MAGRARLILSSCPGSLEAALAVEPQGADLVELRLEAIAPERLTASALARLFGRPELPAIATCRPAGFRGAERERPRLLEAASAAGAAFVDVEWETFRAGGALAVPRDRLILSFHGPLATAQQLAPELAAARPHVVKLAVDGSGPQDYAPLRHLTRELTALGVEPCVFATGEVGTPTRLLAARWGGWAIYAAAGPGEETAAGQLTISELSELYRARELSPRSFVAGVAGWPLAHSLSPRLHNRAYRELGLDGVYLPLPARDAAALVAALGDEGFRGASITRPLKEAAYRAVARRGASAAAVGATNTLVRDADGALRAENTDAPAVRATLEASRRLAGARVAILGTGGAARAAAAACRAAGSQIAVAGRDAGRARSLAADFGALAIEPEALADWGWEILVNATPIGQLEEASPVAAGALTGDTVLDFVYTPARTRLLRDAEARGLRALSGLDVFLRQAADQLELFTGARLPLEVLRELVAGV